MAAATAAALAPPSPPSPATELLEPRGGPTLWLRQQLRGSPDVPIQSFAYNPLHRQLLSCDVEGGRRLWSLKGEVLYEPWDHVAGDDADLQSYQKPPDVVLLRFLRSMDCYLIIYRSQDWSRRRASDLSPRELVTDMPLALLLSPDLEILHKFRPSLSDPFLAVLSEDERFLVVYDTSQVQTFFSLVTEGGRQIKGATLRAMSGSTSDQQQPPPQLRPRQLKSKLLGSNDVRVELEEQGVQTSMHDDKDLLKLMDLSPTDLLAGLFATTVMVWRVSAVRGVICTKLHFLPDVIMPTASFTSAAWSSCMDDSGQLLTGCDNGRLLLWQYDDSKGLELLVSTQAHANSGGDGKNGGRNSVAGIHPYPSPASDSVEALRMRHHHKQYPHTSTSRGNHGLPGAGEAEEEEEDDYTLGLAAQRGVQGCFLTVGSDGCIAHWLAVQQVTTYSTDEPEEEDDSVVAGTNTQQQWHLLELGRRLVGADPPLNSKRTGGASRKKQRQARRIMPGDAAFIDLRVQNGTRGMVVCKSGGLLSIIEVFHPSFLFARLPSKVVDMKRYPFSRGDAIKHDFSQTLSNHEMSSLTPSQGSFIDSCYLVTLSSSGVVQVYDTAVLNASVVAEIQLPSPPTANPGRHMRAPEPPQPTCLDVSMEHKYVIVGMSNGTVTAAWLVDPAIATSAYQKSRRGSKQTGRQSASKTTHGTPQGLASAVPVTAISLVTGNYALSGDADGTITLLSIAVPSLTTSALAHYPAHQAPVMSIQRLQALSDDLMAGQVATCGRIGLIKVWRVDKTVAPQPYVLTRPQLRFVTHLQSERPHTACAVMPGGHGVGGGYSAICGFEDGSIEMLHAPGGVEEDHEQRCVYRSKSHASRVMTLDYLPEKRMLVSTALDQLVLVWTFNEMGQPRLQRSLAVANTSPLPCLLLFSDAQTAVLIAQDRDLSLLPLNSNNGPSPPTPMPDSHPNPCLLTVEGLVLPSTATTPHRLRHGSPHRSLSPVPASKLDERPITYCAGPRLNSNLVFDKPLEVLGPESTENQCYQMVEDSKKKTSSAPNLTHHHTAAPSEYAAAMEDQRSTDESTISSWDHTSMVVTPRGNGTVPARLVSAPSNNKKDATAIKELKRIFSWPNIKERTKQQQRTANGRADAPESRDVKETDILRDTGFRAAFVTMDEENSGRVPVSQLLSVLNGWWHKINDSVLDSLRLAMQECNVKDGDMLTLHRVAQVATQLVRLLGKAPSSVYLGNRLDTPFKYVTRSESGQQQQQQGGTDRRKSPSKRDTIKPFYSMLKERTKIVYNEMGEARRVRVPLPDATHDAYRGLSRKEVHEREKEAKASKRVTGLSLCIPTRLAYDPVPSYTEAPPAKVLSDYWAAHSKSTLPVPRSLSTSTGSLVSAVSVASSSMLTHATKHVIERQALVHLVRTLLDHLTDVLMESFERGLLHRGLISTEAAIDALYKYYLLNMGIPDVVRSRLDSLYQSALYHDDEAACRLIVRLLQLSEDHDLYPNLTDEFRTLCFRTRHWLRSNDLITPSTHTVSRRSALVVCKQLLSAEEYGPRFLLDLQEMAYQLPDLQGSFPSLNELDETQWEVDVDLNVFLESLLHIAVQRGCRMRNATETLFSSLPAGTLAVSRSSSRAGAAITAAGTSDVTSALATASSSDDSVVLALQRTRKVLDAFLERDSSRQGVVDLEHFSNVVLTCLLSAAAPAGAATDGEEQPILEVSTKEFEILRVLVYVYRDGADGAICYLDFWSMLFTEACREGRIPPFLELADKAKTHMLGIDDEQRNALLVYAGYYPQRPDKSSSSYGSHDQNQAAQAHQSLISRGVLKQLALYTQPSSFAPGNLHICKPTLRMTRPALSIPPPLGWPRYCHIFGPTAMVRMARDDRPRSAQSVRAYVQTRQGRHAELRQWDMTMTKGEDVSSCAVQELERQPGQEYGFAMRPMSPCPEVDWVREIEEDEEQEPAEDDSYEERDDIGGAHGWRRRRRKAKDEVEASTQGRYNCQGRAASPVKLIKYKDMEGERLLNEIRDLLGREVDADLLKADKGRLQRYLHVLRERLRRKVEKERREQEEAEKVQMEKDLLSSLLRQELDFLSQEERVIDGIRQKYKDAFNDDVEERRQKQEQAKQEAVQLMKAMDEEKHMKEEAKRKKAEEEHRQKEAEEAARAQAKAELESTRRAKDAERRLREEEAFEAQRQKEEAAAAELRQQEEEQEAARAAAAAEAERAREEDEEMARKQHEKEEGERMAMEAEEIYMHRYEAEILRQELAIVRIREQEAAERVAMAWEEQNMRDFMREEQERMDMEEEEAYQRCVELVFASKRAAAEKKKRDFEDFVQRVTDFTIKWALAEMAAEDEEAERASLEAEEAEHTRQLEVAQERVRKGEEAKMLMEMEIRDESIDDIFSSAQAARQCKDGIMFYQPMAFAADIAFDPFHPLCRDWKGRDDGTINTARSSELSEDEIPRWLSQKEVVKFHQDFRTYGEDYKNWPPMFETAKVLWHEYFVDMEQRVLFPKEPPAEEHYLVRLERELLAKKKVIREAEQYWAAKAKEHKQEREGGGFSWRALHIKYTQSNRHLIHLPHGSVFTGEVDNDQLVYFRVDVPKSCILTLVVRKLSGDVDVFVSKDTVPSILSFDFKMTSLEAVDRLLIQPTDAKGGQGSYVVGVYGPGGTSKFSICALLSVHDTERAGAGTATFNRVASRLRFLAKHSESGALLWNFEQISMMADEYLAGYSEVAKEAELMEQEVSDEELLDSVTTVMDEDLLELSDDDFTKAGIDFSLANEIETWRPNFDALRTRKGFKVTLRQRRRLRQLLRKKREASGAPPNIESGFIKVYIPNAPTAHHYTVSKLDRAFRPDVVRAKDAAMRESQQQQQQQAQQIGEQDDADAW